MSESKRTLEDSNLQSSGNSRDEEADCRVSNEISLLSEPLDLSIRKDAVGSEPDTYGEEADCHISNEISLMTEPLDLSIRKDAVGSEPDNQNNREGENEEHEVESQADSVPVEDTSEIVYEANKKSAGRSIAFHNRNQFADYIKRYCPICKITVADINVSTEQLCDECGTKLDFQCVRCDRKFDTYIKLIWHQQSCSTVLNYNCSRCDYTSKNKSLFQYHMRRTHKVKNKSIAASDREELSAIIKRFCPTCKITVAKAKKAVEQTCTQCGTQLIYQCARCNKESKSYGNLFVHIRAKCNFDCPLCGYPADTEVSLKNHLRTCLDEIQYKCCFCKYRDKSRVVLRRHMLTVHKDILKIDCSKYKKKPYKCKECKKKVLICKTCYTGFSSTGGFQEHLKSCKPPVLKCIFCSLSSEGYENFKSHMIIAHLSASTSQN